MQRLKKCNRITELCQQRFQKEEKNYTIAVTLLSELSVCARMCVYVRAHVC